MSPLPLADVIAAPVAVTDYSTNFELFSKTRQIASMHKELVELHLAVASSGAKNNTVLEL